MVATITLGLLLVGAALGAGVAWFLLRGRSLESGAALLAGMACVLAGAGVAQCFVTPVVIDAWATDRARTELLAIPVYAVIEGHEPVVFERLLAEYKFVVRDRSHMDRYTQVMNAELGMVATKHIAHASDAALLALMQDMLDKLRLLRTKSPEDCYRYLFPKIAGPPDLTRWFDRDSQAHTLGLIADVVRTSSETPVAVPPRTVVEPLLSPLVNEMYARFGENTALLSRTEERGVSHGTVCDIATTLYEKVMRLPPADAAAVIRSMTQL